MVGEDGVLNEGSKGENGKLGVSDYPVTHCA